MLWAQTFTWVGGGGIQSWNVGANWLTGTVPNSATADVVFNNVSVTLINIPAGTQVRDFTLSGTSNVTLSGNLNIGRNLAVPSGCSFTASAGTTVTLNGASVTQDIGGEGNTTFHNLTIDKASNVRMTITSPIQLHCQQSCAVCR
ncbi:MAG: hypothetical protein RML35_11820 [Chloroherpetonaceae bacterium]|nr:hypothetical protein [Chloroherpetonaceae bacterium]